MRKPCIRAVSALTALAFCAEPGLAQAPESARLDNPVAAIRLEALRATRDQPLFSSSRKPVEKAAPIVESPAEPPQTAPPPNLVLTGVVVERGGARALVRNNDTNEVVRLRPGDQVGEWQVKSIQPRRIVLKLGEREAEFGLFTGEPRRAKPGDGTARSDEELMRLSPDTAIGVKGPRRLPE